MFEIRMNSDHFQKRWITVAETRKPMGIETLLAKKKRAIVKDWLDMVVNTYAPDTAKFLKGNLDPFSNPVGGALHSGLNGLYDQLVEGPQKEAVRTHLDPIVRIRAVQKFSPSQATAFVLALKPVVRTHLRRELRDSQTALELRQFEDRIDSMSLFAFDIYMECREKLYDLKTNFERKGIRRAFQRAGLIEEAPEDESEP
jgi:hypothetical protein